MKEPYYKPSGRFTAKYFLFFLLFAGISIPILSAVYIYLVYYIPIVYFNVIITVGCGSVLGLIMSQATHMGKARNPPLVWFCTLAATIAMKYVQWCIYIPLVFDDAYGLYGEGVTIGTRFTDSLYLFTAPSEIYKAASIINEVGVWGISRSGSNGLDTVNGIVLLIVWIAEFMLMACMAVIISRQQYALPFSESSDTWYTELNGKIEMNVPDNIDSFRHDMENGRFDELIRLVHAGRTYSTHYLSMTVCEPPQAAVDEPCYISVERTGVGKIKKTKTLFRHLAIDTQSISVLLGRTATGS